MEKIDDVINKYNLFRDDAENLLTNNDFLVDDKINVNVHLNSDATPIKTSYCKFTKVKDGNVYFRYWIDKIPSNCNNDYAGELDVPVQTLDSETLKQILEVLKNKKHIKYLY